jgi:WD40 repeat protein
MTLRRMFVTLLLCLITALTAYAPHQGRADDTGSSPILYLDPGGHTAQVDQVLFTPDGKELISVGEDKAIRVWNAETGESVRTIRGQIGDGPLGKLFAAALSPDGKTLAVGGFLHGTTDPTFYIRLIDPATGSVIRIITGLFKPALALAFSPDGKTLASGDGTGTLRLCDVQTGQSVSLKGHTKDIYGVAFAPSGQQVATASLDGTVRLWDVGTHKSRVLDGKVPLGYRCVTWSADGHWIAAGGLDHTIHVWDGTSGAVNLTLDEGKFVNCIAFSPDSKRLAAGFGSDTPAECDVRLWSVTGSGVGSKPIGEFTHHSATVQAVAFSPDSATVASAGGLADDIYLWTGEGANIKRHLASSGGATQDIAWSPDSTKITWKNQASAGPIQHTFNLADRSLIPDPAQPWQGAVLTHNGSTLTITDGGTTVQGTGGGHITLTRPGDQVQCVTWTPDGSVVVGSTFGLGLYDKNGSPLRGFIGHTAAVLSVSVSPDGKYLASTSGDQTVRIWPLDPAAASSDNLVTPLASVFVGQDREWVEWTHSGYYTCSTNGENIIGWQINKGDQNAAEFYPASRFHATFFRDDILGSLLTAGSEAQAIALADKNRTEKTDLTKTAANIAAFAPPTVEILDPAPGQTIADAQVTLHVKITDPNHRPLKDLKLSDNFRPVPPPADGPITPQEGEMTLTAPLTPGDNTLSVVVGNDANAESVPATVKVTYGAVAPPQIGSPTLYMISIGVSQYLDTTNTLQFPAKDAGDIASVFQAQQGPGKMFSKVVVKQLTDRKANRDGIISSLVALRKQAPQMGPNDYTIIFIAGHGTNDDLDQYFFAPYDIDADNVDVTGVQWLTFSQTLAQLPGKVILMLDTCHSAGVEGKIDKKDGYGRFLVATSLARFNNESPVITFASCGKGELSQESTAWDNGAFTKALVEGLTGKADTNQDGIVTISELSQYLDQRVSSMTKQAQNPVLTKPASISGDLPLAVVGPIVSHTASTGVADPALAKTP